MTFEVPQDSDWSRRGLIDRKVRSGFKALSIMQLNMLCNQGRAAGACGRAWRISSVFRLRIPALALILDMMSALFPEVFAARGEREDACKRHRSWASMRRQVMIEARHGQYRRHLRRRRQGSTFFVELPVKRGVEEALR